MLIVPHFRLNGAGYTAIPLLNPGLQEVDASHAESSITRNLKTGAKSQIDYSNWRSVMIWKARLYTGHYTY
jgi:hypothetical protein